jgi:hypothetical protein
MLVIESRHFRLSEYFFAVILIDLFRVSNVSTFRVPDVSTLKFLKVLPF